MASNNSTNVEVGFYSTTSFIQLGYGVWMWFTEAAIGLAFGFTAVAIPQMTYPKSDLALSLSEAAWAASILTLFSPVGCLICGVFIDRFGRRAMIVLCEIPMCLGWLYSGFARTAKDIIIGRMIIGIGIGMAIGAPRIYMSEITLPNMRGVIGAFANVALSTGLTLQATLGTFFKWNTLCFIGGGYTAVLTCLNLFLPETPYYLLLKDDSEAAIKTTLRKFRSKSYDIDSEMTSLMAYKQEHQIKRLTFREKVRLLFTSLACIPFWIVIPYMLIAQLSGITILMFYAVEMLGDSKSTVDPNVGNVALGLTRLFSGIFTSFLLFKVGRRPLALMSSIGVGCVCLTIGIYIIQPIEPTAFPQICYMLYVFLSALGYYTLPLLIMCEIYPLQVRGMLTGLSITFLNLAIFASNKSFPYVRRAIGFPYTMIGFGCFSFIGALFLYLFLPETKDMSLHEIENHFTKIPRGISRASIALSRLNLEYDDCFEKQDRHVTLKNTDREADVSQQMIEDARAVDKRLSIIGRRSVSFSSEISLNRRKSALKDRVSLTPDTDRTGNRLDDRSSDRPDNRPGDRPGDGSDDNASNDKVDETDDKSKTKKDDKEDDKT